MQKRRGGGGASALPMTVADAQRNGAADKSKRKKRRRRGAPVFFCGPMFWGFATIVVMFILVLFLLQKAGFGGSGGVPDDDAVVERTYRQNVVTSDGGELPLANFPTLSYAMDNSDIVAICFAASWCPMSTPVTEAIHDAFSKHGEGENALLLPPPPPGGAARESPKEHKLSLVYVSSDRSKEDMKSYSRTNWINVPYDSEERMAIKKHFRVFAKVEMAELGVDRRFEIPTLIVIDSKTHGVLSTNGAEDVKEKGIKALEHWLELQHLVRSMEDKYEV